MERIDWEMRIEIFNSLLKEYLRYIGMSMEIMRCHYKCKKYELLRAWHQKKIPQIGFVKGHLDFQFHFHGIGCECFFEDGSFVDFDFKPDGRPIFDSWRLMNFATSHSKKFDLGDPEKLRPTLDQYLKDAKITKEYKEGFYYIPQYCNGCKIEMPFSAIKVCDNCLPLIDEW